MGWNSWDCFGTTVTEAQTKAQTDVMAAKLARYGWQYVVVDIQWYEPSAKGFDYKPGAPLTMDANGRLLPAPAKFPSAANGAGFKALAAYVHGKGLKFGIHMMRGIPRQAVAQNTPILGTPYHARDIADTSSICAWNPDMYGVDMSKPGAQAYYDSMFRQYAAWGVDFVKVDDLSRPYHREEIEGLRTAIDRSGRPMVFSTSPGETPLQDGEHVQRHANMWRISDDFWDSWPALFEQFERLRQWAPFSTAGHFPDADMLPIGTVRFTEQSHFTRPEQTTLLSLWSIVRSPLMMGGDLTKLDDFTLSLLTNEEVLAVNRSSSDAHQLFNRDGQIGWVADVPNSQDKYLALFNTSGPAFVRETGAAFKSALVTRDTPGHGVAVDADITGAKKLYLVVDDGGDTFDADHADWGEPRLSGPKGDLKLTDLPMVRATAGWGQVSTQRAVGGGTMSVDGKPVAYGIGTHARSIIEYDLPPGYTRFRAFAVLDDGGTRQAKGATVRFHVFTSDPTFAGANTAVKVGLDELGFNGACRIRDLWAKRDVGTFKGEFAPTLPVHGAGLYRVTPIK